MTIRKHIPWLTVLLALIIIPGPNYSLSAQPNPEETRPSYIWLNIGIGYGLGSHVFAGGLNLSFQPSRPGYLLFSLRAAGTSDILDPSPISDAAFLVGYSSKRPGARGYYSIGSGLGLVFGESKTLGVPVDAQLFYTPLSFAGIGLQGFANFNTEETFWGVLLCLQFGKLR